MINEYQEIVGAIVTLIAAFIGFGGIIYSQRALVAMTREQAATAREAELKSIKTAFAGEMPVLEADLGRAADLVTAHIAMAEELRRAGSARKTPPRISFAFATPVFDSHVSRLGLLSPELSRGISRTYGQLKSYSLQTQSDVPDMEAGVAAEVMRSVAGRLETLKRELGEVCRLLEREIAGVR